MGMPPPREDKWEDIFVKETNDNINQSKVNFVGRLDRSDYLKILHKSWFHAYLTIPFVLSWSL